MAKATRKTLKEKRIDALAAVEAAKAALAAIESATAERIGKLAIRAGMADIDLTDEQISAAFEKVVADFRKAPAPAPKPTATATGTASPSQS